MSDLPGIVVTGISGRMGQMLARTIQASDKARLVYSAVLEANKTVLATAKPGVPWEELHRVAERIIATHLVEMGILKGSVDECLKAHAQAVFFPHGLGHPEFELDHAGVAAGLSPRTDAVGAGRRRCVVGRRHVTCNA